ncbi:MAG: hypothetical protein JO011_16315, partial [Ktedonobacteraceae bacterium]|nr:hypothetical protein [Ktedonobacteraceae bacterium]MBV9712470.1 hypothetical protein [Ktedonobacteraceae bacterium]
MKRFVFGSLLICLLLLSSGYFVTTQAGAHSASRPGIQQSSPHSTISDAHLKALVRQALGQQAVDAMKHRSTQT